MSDIVAFLTAQLDADQAAAEATTPVPTPGRWDAVRDKHADNDAPLGLIQGEDKPEYGPNDGDYQHGVPVIAFAADWQTESVENLKHIARHDPARVLAEVEAKRRRLQRHRPEITEYYDRHGEIATFTACEICGNGGTTDDAWPCGELLDDAAPYAREDGYDENWRP